MNEQKIRLELSIEETNVVLAALGKMPYEDVFLLIGNIQQQATQQVQANSTQKQ